MVHEKIGLHGYVTVEVTRKDGTKEIICKDKPNLMTTVGEDFMHSQVYANSGITTGANYIGLSTNATAPDIGDTTLTGEIVAGGLERAQGTVTHVAGTNTTTIVKAFTASTTFTGVQKVALFNQSSGGIMVHENTITSVNLETSDIVTITWTITS
jgi:hypothetical protein